MINQYRSKVVQAIEASGIPAARLSCVKDYRAGGADVRLDEMEIDSLAFMELCIWWELDYEVSLAPEQVRGAGSLDGIARLLEQNS